MKSPRIGKLPPRYKFLPNPHEATRLARCFCGALTYPRKFALLIHIDGWGLMPFGKTCKFCAKDQLIICHQDELDAQLADAFSRLKPEVIGNDYLVVGTVKMEIFKKGLLGGQLMGEVLNGAADFIEEVRMGFDPGGWRHNSADPSKYTIDHDYAAKHRQTPWTAGRKRPPNLTQ